MLAVDYPCLDLVFSNVLLGCSPGPLVLPLPIRDRLAVKPELVKQRVVLGIICLGRPCNGRSGLLGALPVSAEVSYDRGLVGCCYSKCCGFAVVEAVLTGMLAVDYPCLDLVFSNVLLGCSPGPLVLPLPIRDRLAVKPELVEYLVVLWIICLDRPRYGRSGVLRASLICVEGYD